MSNLFKPYRAVGVYSGNAPGIVYFHGRRRYHIAEIPIDNCFHSYKGKIGYWRTHGHFDRLIYERATFGQNWDIFTTHF